MSKMKKEVYLDRLRCVAVDGYVERGKVKNYSAYKNWFDSFEEACESIGLKAVQLKENITKELMLQRIRDAAIDGVVRRKDIKCQSYVDVWWDKWSDACKEAGVKGRYINTGEKITYPVKRDCEMYISDKNCRGLKSMYCAIEENCVFYKPKEVGK